jgi:hypothetical protein
MSWYGLMDRISNNLISPEHISDYEKYSYIAALLDAKNGDRLTHYEFNAFNVLKGKPVVAQSDAYYLTSNLEVITRSDGQAIQPYRSQEERAFDVFSPQVFLTLQTSSGIKVYSEGYDLATGNNLPDFVIETYSPDSVKAFWRKYFSRKG